MEIFTDLSLKRRVRITDWSQKLQKLAGKTDENNITREKIRSTINQINAAYDELKLEKQLLTSEAVKAKAEGSDQDPHTLNFLMNYHNVELKQLIEEGTLKNYRSTEKFIQEFLIKKRKKKDIYLAQLNNLFITDFGLYMLNRVPDKGQRPCSNNTLMKHMERLKKMIGIALKNKWITNDPFIYFERKIIPRDRDCLTSEELRRVNEVKLNKSGLNIIRDLFCFSCLTGLAYSDISRLNNQHLIKDPEGERYIEMYREKTKNFTERKFHVLLLPEALILINKYQNHPAAMQNGTVFPYYSNQAVNRYLKLIASKAKVLKPMTFHLARHTFATTVTLENNVPMETVSHMLGHASVRTTQIYSKVKKKKVFKDMTDLKAKLTLQ